MEEKPRKKTLHLKIILVTVFSILAPLILSQTLIHNPMYAAIVGIIFSILAILAIFVMLKPLDSLIKATESLGRINLNHRFDIRSGDEFEEVGQSFNLMADRLKESFEKLEQDKDIISSERNKLSAILSSLIDGIIALDFNKNVLLVNQSGEFLTGFTQKEMEGKPIDQFINLFSDGEEVFSKSYCQANFSQTLKLVGKNGKETNVNIASSASSFGVQTNLGCILILHDLSKENDLERMKLDFVSMASHELKTPLTSIIGYLSVFLNENRGNVRREEMELLEKSFVSAQQLLTLIQNILNVNKIERDQLSVHMEPTDLYAILLKATDDLSNLAKQKNIILNLTQPRSSLPKVMVDPVRIAEVVTNLVANALNYTNPGGQVTIFIQASPTEITTSITDTGVGIPKEALPRLFSKFFRVSNITQQASKGTGLGLYIAKSIINKMNGKIWVESELGKGSRFSFVLPVASKAASLDTQKFTGEAIQSGALNY